MDENTFKTSYLDEDSLAGDALIAEEIFGLLPEETALAARRCIILHWFDLAIIEALLKDRELTPDEMSDIYQQLAALPFIDTIHLGLAFQYTTRQGLLRDYSRKQPEFLQTAARLVAPVYKAYSEDEKNIAEAFFCSIVAGDQETSSALQTALFKQGSRHDWRYFEHLFRLQDEAESLPFVQPLLRTEQHFLLSGLVHRMNGRQDAALLAYNQAIALNPKSVLAYINRGITYAGQERFNEALKDYNTALQVDKKATQAYANRGVIYAKQSRHREALKDFEKAIDAGLSNSVVFYYKGESLQHLGRYEEALTSYNKMLDFDEEDVDAYVGLGQSYNQLENYEQALSSFETALHFNPDAITAYRGKGYALHELERYVEALVAYDNAIALDVHNAEGYRGRGKALSALKRYEEASAAYTRANELDPYHEDGMEGEITTVHKRRHALSSHRLWERLPKMFSLAPLSVQNEHKTLTSSSRIPRGTIPMQGLRSFTERVLNGIVVSIVIIFILVSVSLFFVSRTSTGGPGHRDATANPPALQGCTVNSTGTTPTPGPTIDVTPTPGPTIDVTPTPGPTIDVTPSPTISVKACSFSLHIDKPGLLNNSTSAINSIEQQIRSLSFLKGRYVALAIVYAGAPTDADIESAVSTSKEIYRILRSNQSGSSFSKASYYDPLFVLGDSSSSAKVDIYLFQQGSTTNNRLELNFHRLTLQINANGLLNNNSSAINNLEQQIRGQSILHGRRAGLVIVYGGASTDNDINTALKISSKTYDILRILGKEDLTFRNTFYYDPLYTLGSNTNTITIDFFLFTA